MDRPLRLITANPVDQLARTLEALLVVASAPLSVDELADAAADDAERIELALGSAYEHPVDDPAERQRINKSKVHVDFMIGSPELDVDGITRDGEHLPVLRGGAWQV